MQSLQKVSEYHELMGISIAGDINISRPALNRYRIKIMSNEIFKLNHALEVENKPGVLEYFMNLQIELDSSLLSLGFAAYKELAFYCVHQANMTKLNDNGKPTIMEDGRIAETENYQPPNLSRIITQIKQSKE